MNNWRISGIELKLEVKNGQIVSEQDMSSFIGSVPKAWIEGIDAIFIEPASGGSLVTSFHSTEKKLGIHVPENSSATRDKVLAELACTLQAIRDFGHIPRQIPASQVRKYLQNWADLET